DLHVRVDDGILADDALVAHHRPLLDPHVRPQVGVAPDHAAPQRRLGAHVDVVVEHRAFEERVGLHDHVGAEHGVGPDVHAGFDAAAVADHDRIVDASLGTDLHVGTDPTTLTELEALDLNAHLAVE